MGRKGGGGGTAGGTRSSGRNDVTYQRVVPRFLRGLLAEPYDQGQEESNSKTFPRPPGVETYSKGSTPSGFNPEGKQPTSAGKQSGNPGKVATLEKAEERDGIQAQAADDNRRAKSNMLQGGIEKKSVRGKRPARTLTKTDRTRLSFAECDSEGSAD